MVGVSILGQDMLVINTEEIAVELLDKKSLKYSDRPNVAMAGELVGWKDSLGMLSLGDRFRKHRKMIHQVIGTPATTAKHHAVQEREVRQLLVKLLEAPHDFAKHIRRYVQL